MYDISGKMLESSVVIHFNLGNSHSYWKHEANSYRCKFHRRTRYTGADKFKLLLLQILANPKQRYLGYDWILKVSPDHQSNSVVATLPLQIFLGWGKILVPV